MTFNILSLDGGGAWALLEAMALQDLFDDAPGHQILAHFDLAVANSGGSIVLAGLIENMSPSRIAELFLLQGNRQAIFAKTPFVENLLSHVPIFPKYSSPGKLTGLTGLFGVMGGEPLSSLSARGDWPKGPNGQPVKILIVSFDYDDLRATFFRSYPTSPGAWADDVSLVDAVHGSTNAPVIFFDAPALFANRRYWDGAMGGFNNPLMAGVTDLLAEGASAGEIVALSIGTGTVKLLPPDAKGLADANLKQPLQPQNVLNDLQKAASCINDDPPDNATYTAHVILTGARGGEPTLMGPVVRLNPVVRPVLDGGVWRVPEGLLPSEFDALKALSMDAVEQGQITLIHKLGTSWITGTVPNQPVRMTAELKAEPGDETFAEGKTRWRAL